MNASFIFCRILNHFGKHIPKDSYIKCNKHEYIGLEIQSNGYSTSSSAMPSVSISLATPSSTEL